MEPLAYLDGRPIFEGTILYSRDREPLRALNPWLTSLPLRMEAVNGKKAGCSDYWATDTHWKGGQVLFWSLNDIPDDKDVPLYWSLLSQLRVHKERKQDGNHNIRRIRRPKATIQSR